MKKTFDEVFFDNTKLGTKVPTNEYSDAGKYIIVDQGRSQIAGYTDKEQGVFKDVPAIIFGDHTRVIKYVDRPFFLGADGTKILKSKLKDTNYKYLFYALKNVRIPNTGYNRHFKWLKMVSINYPSLLIQSNIAVVLDKLAYIIECKQRELELYDELVKARFVEMFGNPLHPNKYLKLGKIAILERGRFSPRPRNDPKYFNGEYPFIQTGDISSSNHRLSEYKQTLNEQGIKVSKKFCVGTIVMAIVGATIGATAILEREVYAPDSVIGITPYNYNNVFLETLLQFWQPQLLANAPECARSNINLAILGEVPIIDVDVVLQNQFADFVNQVNKSKAVIEKSLKELETLQASLMQKYFS